MSRRKHDNHDITTSSKHQKITTDNKSPIIDDVLFTIMSFLPTKFLFNTLTRVSRQFNQVVHLVPSKFEAYGVSRFIPFLSDRSEPIHLAEFVARFEQGDNLDTFRALMKCPGLNHLKSLVLEGDQDAGFCIDNEVCEVLAQMESLSHLKELNFLGGCTFDHVGMGYVVNSPHLGRVEVLTVKSSEFHKANVLTKSPMMARLTSFTSWDCDFSQFELDRELPKLKTLAFESMEDDGDELECMPDLTKCTNLTRLVLNGVGDLECRLVAESPLRQLEDLTLFGQVEDMGVKYIASSPYLKNLKKLNLPYNDIGDNGLKYLSNSENMANLKYLDITDNNVTSEGIRALSSSQHFSNLEHLELIGVDMTSEMCELIAHSPHLTHLKKLSLNSNIPSHNLSILCSNLHLTHLRLSGYNKFPAQPKMCQLLSTDHPIVHEQPTDCHLLVTSSLHYCFENPKLANWVAVVINHPEIQ